FVPFRDGFLVAAQAALRKVPSQRVSLSASSLFAGALRKPQRAHAAQRNTFETRRNGGSGGYPKSCLVARFSSANSVFLVLTPGLPALSAHPIPRRQEGGRGGPYEGSSRSPKSPPLPPFLRVSKVLFLECHTARNRIHAMRLGGTFGLRPKAALRVSA